MRSWKPRPRGSAPGPAAWLLDEHADLVREPRLVGDARLLAAVHAELRERLGASEAATALLQIGYALGLRDALRALRGGFQVGRAASAPAAPTLAIQLDAHPPGETGAVFALHGTWPVGTEAAARAVKGLGERGCHVSAGYTSGWLSGLYDADLVALEQTCVARGDGVCRFVAREPSAWRVDADPAAVSALSALAGDEIRVRIEAELDAEQIPRPDSVLDPDSPAVHVWGPVMIVPFGGSDDSLRAVDLIGRDPAARDVSVVVLDLTGAVIDEGFGALALENVLDAIEAWGAEPILAGVSPLSEPVVADLQRAHLVVRKDLTHAIASAFQIAQAQRRFA